MANPNFVANYSTNEIFRNEDTDRCLTDDLDTIESDIADLETNKADSDHTHSGYAAADHTHTGYASESHTHSGYAATSHTHSEYAGSSHTHAQTDITGLVDALASKAAGNHGHSYNDLSDKPIIPASYTHPSTHPASIITGLATVATSGKYSDLTGKPTIPTTLPANGGNADTVDGKHASDFAAASHTHDYLPLTGGTVTGETNFSGGLVRLKGVQTLYHTGAQIVFGSNNLPSRIAGSAITATKTIQVDSDERLKENVAPVDAEACLKLIEGIDVKTFNYIGNDDSCMGVIAQELENNELAKFFVSTGPEGYLAVKEAGMIWPTIVALQKALERIEELEAKVATLEAHKCNCK